MRQPSLITSPIWQLAQFEPVYPRLVERLLQAYEDLINTFASQPEVETFLRQNRGALNWWLGNLTATEADWDRSGSLLNQAVLSAPEPDVLRAKVADLADSAAKLTLQAWINPASRQSLLEQAWAFSQRDGALSEVTPPTEAIAELQQGMENSSSLRQWLTENAPTWEPRSQRLGFGALSRHVDGPLPSDFLPRIENIPMTLFLQT